jgi:hypothetical protein
MTVFGIMTLGKPLAIPQCEKLKPTKKAIPFYDPAPKTTCFKHREIWGEERIWPDQVSSGSVDVVFPALNGPAIVSGSAVYVNVIDGNLEAIQFETGGYSAQDEVLSQLKKKYGEPSRAWDEERKNLMGASFGAHKALWSLPDLVVTFDGMGEKVDSGQVNIYTRKGWDAAAAALKKNPERPQL